MSIAGIDGNGQSELIQAVTGLIRQDGGKIFLNNEDVKKKTIRYKNTHGISHIPEDRHKHGLVLEYSVEDNLVLQEYFESQYQNLGFINHKNIHENAVTLIEQYDIRSGGLLLYYFPLER